LNQQRREPSSLPTLVTWARIAIAPLVVLLMDVNPMSWGLIAATLFSIGALTDWLDGYLARKMDAVSTWGKFLDPLADKVLVSSTLIMMAIIKLLDPYSVIILFNRDILIGGVRSLAASRGQIIAAGPAGKWKTALQMIAIPILLVAVDPFFLPLRPLGILLIWISVALSLFSGWQYFNSFRSHKTKTS